MMENDTQKSQQAASTALHNAPKLAKIAQAGVQGGPAGAATEAAVQYCKEILVVAIAVLLLPVLVLLMLPGAIFGTLTQPSTAVNHNFHKRLWFVRQSYAQQVHPYYSSDNLMQFAVHW